MTWGILDYSESHEITWEYLFTLEILVKLWKYTLFQPPTAPDTTLQLPPAVCNSQITQKTQLLAKVRQLQ